MKPWLGDDEAEAAADAVRSGWVAQGPRVSAFESALATRVGADHAVACNSCTTALHLALVLLGIGPGDEVVVPSLSFIATANVVVHMGATPVFADVDFATLNLTPQTVAAVMTDRTRAVILVHQAGTPADIDAMRVVCDPAGVAIVEDAACAIGAEYKGRPIGSHSDLVAFSFHPRKVITTGEGGMLVVAREDWADRARGLREHGTTASAAARHQSDSVIIEGYSEIGFNYRMTDIQAAVGLVQLGKLDAIVTRRRELAERYHEMLDDLPGFTLSRDPAWGRANFQSFWVLLADDAPMSRDELLRTMLAEGISARRGIMAAHLEPAYLDHPHVDLPVTEHVSRRSLILPMYHEMTWEEQRHVVSVLRKEVGAAALSMS
jgi:perosamine synthetase